MEQEIKMLWMVRGWLVGSVHLEFETPLEAFEVEMLSKQLDLRAWTSKEKSSLDIDSQFIPFK